MSVTTRLEHAIAYDAGYGYWFEAFISHRHLENELHNEGGYDAEQKRRIHDAMMILSRNLMEHHETSHLIRDRNWIDKRQNMVIEYDKLKEQL